MAHAFLAVGSNLGDRNSILKQARQKLEKNSAIHFLRTSSVYETEPVGGPPQGKYLNAVWEIETNLTPEKLLAELLAIEKISGRERGAPNAPRTLDLDILSYDDKMIQQPGLSIPHPRLQEREFVLKPLAEIAPGWMHPCLKKTAKELLEGFVENHS